MFRALLLCFLITLTSTGYAHNVVAGAYTDGMLVEGEIGLSNGDMAQVGLLVEVFDATGNKLGETKVEEDGLFSYQAKKPMTHIFKANLGAGHVANIAVEGNEFAGFKPSESNKPTATSPNQIAGIDAQELERIVRQAVSQQVKPLQKELRAYKEKVMIRDIMGGLGFILGIVGIAAYMSAKRKEKS